MTKAQFWILNIVGGLCALLILSTIVLGSFNERTNQTLAATQSELGRADQMQTTMRNLVLRIAQSAQTNLELSALLARHDFKLNTNSEPRTPQAP